MPRPRVLLDCDEVLADFLTPAYALYNQIAGTKLSVLDQDEWDMMKILDPKYKEDLYHHLRQPGFCASLKPLPGAIEGVKLLQELADVFVVTSPIHGRHWYFERVEWVHDHFGLPHKNVHHTSHKHHVVGDVFVDDHPGHVRNWQAAHPRGKAFLWANHANRHDLPLARISEWLTVAAAVRCL